MIVHFEHLSEWLRQLITGDFVSLKRINVPACGAPYQYPKSPWHLSLFLLREPKQTTFGRVKCEKCAVLLDQALENQRPQFANYLAPEQPEK